ncbi:hypothetical protein [uncultured Anaerotruncus sp.]|uniref:hypothetical protein n=1 Tax=uncultured Anaerotruncus sp. TaxID=905011 RepID=UPI00280C2F08|nr:hypothetical protein [uncultured Anaerotruncus sp.]
MNRTIAVLLALSLFLTSCVAPAHAPAASSAPESAVSAASSTPPEPKAPETASETDGAAPAREASAPPAEADRDFLPSGVRDLTYAEALGDPDFGGCVPQELAEGVAMREASRGVDFLFISFEQAVGSAEYRELVLSISRAEPGDEGRAVDIGAVESYDVHLYEIPWADSVPAEYRETFDHPLFFAEDLSPQVLARRVYDHREPGDEHVAADFSVLCEGGLTVRVMARNIDALALFGLLESLPAVNAGREADG